MPSSEVNLLAKVNDHQTRRMLTQPSWLSRLEIDAWTLQNIFYPKSKNSDGQLIREPAAAGLNQQGHNELHKKTSTLCKRWDEQLERALRKKTFNDVEHLSLQMTVHSFRVILKYGIKYYKNCNSSSSENISVKVSGIVENSFRYKSCNLGKKNPYRLSRNFILSSGTFFEPPGYIWHPMTSTTHTTTDDD